MAFLKYAIPALAVAGRAAAQCSVAGTHTISIAAEAQALGGCQTFTGSIAIATGTTDNIALDGIRVLSGDLIATGVSQITTLTSSTMESISGAMDLEQDQILTTLTFPRLNRVGSLRWVALPGLQDFTFTTGISSADVVYIQDTQIRALTGINLVNVDQFTLISNRFLQEVTMQLRTARNNVTVSENGGEIVVDLPNLVWAGSLSIQNVTSLTTPSLTNINQSMSLLGNNFVTYSAPNLTAVGSTRSGGDLVIIDNSQLQNLSFPVLTTIGGGLTIAKNPQLTSVTGFPELATVAGAVDMNGNFQDTVELPSLDNVMGAFNLQGPNVTAACQHFLSITGRNEIIKGRNTCASTTQPGGAGTNPSTATRSGSSPSSTGNTAAAQAEVMSGAIVGVVGLVAAAFGLC